MGLTRQWNSNSAYIEAHIWNRYVRNTLKVLKCSTAEGCRWSVGPIMWRTEKYGRTPLTRTLVTRIANYPDRLGLWGKICQEFYKTNLRWNCRLWDQVQCSIMASRTSNQAWSKYLHAGTRCISNSRTSNCQSSQFPKKNPIIRIFCVSRCLAVPLNPDKWNSTVLLRVKEESNIL
jgi:hypothetical protein